MCDDVEGEVWNVSLNTIIISDYSGFPLHSNFHMPLGKLMCSFSIQMYAPTKHMLPMYGIRNILTEHKSTV